MPFLYYLMVLVPAVALILGIADRREQAAALIGRAAVIVTAILALLIDWGFLRGNLPSRLPTSRRSWGFSRRGLHRARCGRRRDVATLSP